MSILSKFELDLSILYSKVSDFWTWAVELELCWHALGRLLCVDRLLWQDISAQFLFCNVLYVFICFIQTRLDLSPCWLLVSFTICFTACWANLIAASKLHFLCRSWRKARHLRRKDRLVIQLRRHLRSQLRYLDVYATHRCHGGMVCESRCWFQALRWREKRGCSHRGAVESKVTKSYMGEMVSSEENILCCHA